MTSIVLRIAACALLSFVAATAKAATPAAMPPDCETPSVRGELGLPGFARCVHQVVERSRAAPAEVAPALLDALVQETLARSASTTDPLDVDCMETLFAELERREITTAQQRAALVWTLQLNDRYDEARLRQPPGKSIYASAFPHRVASSAPRPAGARPAWTWHPEADSLAERFVDLAHGAQLLVLCAPDKPACEQAATDIDADAGLKTALAAHATWIMRPVSGLDQDAMRGWVVRHPGLPISVVLDARGWPLPRSCEMPCLLLLRDGQLAQALAGWQPGRARELRAGLRSLGIDVDPR